jgi:hypothetical protein
MGLPFPFVNFLAANRKTNLIPFGYFSPGDSVSWIEGSVTIIPYSTTTITGSPMTITAVTHGQGTGAFGKCWNSAGVEMLGNWSRNSLGDLTLTYVTAPALIMIYP